MDGAVHRRTVVNQSQSILFPRRRALSSVRSLDQPTSSLHRLRFCQFLSSCTCFCVLLCTSLQPCLFRCVSLLRYFALCSGRQSLCQDPSLSICRFPLLRCSLCCRSFALAPDLCSLRFRPTLLNAQIRVRPHPRRSSSCSSSQICVGSSSSAKIRRSLHQLRCGSYLLAKAALHISIGSTKSPRFVSSPPCYSDPSIDD